MDTYSFSTKYCHWSNPNAYPMMDQYVYKAIMRLKKDKLISGFKGGELWDVNIFKYIEAVQQSKITDKRRSNVALNQKTRFDFIAHSNC